MEANWKIPQRRESAGADRAGFSPQDYVELARKSDGKAKRLKKIRKISIE